MRASGILMPVFSLPGPYGIGTLGDEAFAFVDFLSAAKQTYWQILPIGPTGYGDSPYQSFSAFAGNPYFIDYRLLAADGLLTESVRYMCFSRPVATGLDKPGREALVRGMEDGSVRRDLDLEMVYLNLVNLLTGGVNFRILIDEATQMKIIRSSAEILLYYVKNSGR